MESQGEQENFEALMQRLETVVRQLESDDLSLEEAIDAYQKGVSLAKEGHGRLAEAQRRVEELTRDGSTEPLNPGAILGEEAESASPTGTER